jgi:hypothetical protein
VDDASSFRRISVISLRPQMTGGFLPKIVLCIPGGNELRNACAPLLEAADLRYELQAYDQRIKGSFQTASMSWPSLSPGDFTRLDSHTTVLYVLSENFTPASALETCTAMMSVGRQLLDAGGIGIKIDSSGIAHSAQRWNKFAEAIRLNPELRSNVIFDAYVLRPIASDDELYTCGMHLLGAPDLIVAKTVLVPTDSEGEASIVASAAELFRAFGVYLVSECPVGHFAPGHTFSMDAHSPRYRVLWEPCEEYPEDDLFHNPFGLWRFTKA